jgi:pimeloyl-ACP methyl ester carboxylesterase/predicted glycosyltransferase
MRAKEPHQKAFINRSGVRLAYEIYGEGEQTLLFVPTWSLAHSRNYKGQIPYFSETYRCITWDPRGNGNSERPTDPESYGLQNYVDDAIAIMDATETARAILFGYSLGGYVVHGIAAHHPERVAAAITIGPVTSLPTGEPPKPAPGPPSFQTYEGWRQGADREYWRNDYENFSDFFIRKIFVEPHSTKVIEDSLNWAAETNSDVIGATMDAASSLSISLADYQAISCPMLTIHGEQDAIISPAHSRVLAEKTGCDSVFFPQAGHAVHARFPAKVNLLTRDFLEKHLGRNEGRAPKPKSRRNQVPKVLYLSSPIGLGHARRDLAIANELRSLHPDLDLHWLAQDPVTRFLKANQEQVHPGSSRLASESAHLESESGEHDLNAFEAIRRMDEILVANFMTFQEVLEHEDFDLVIADEAWDVDHYWHEHPELKRTAIAWLTDFVGWVPMPEGGAREAMLTRDYNAEMIGHIESNPRIRDRSIFVGNPQDVLPGTFGADLPDMRTWVSNHFDFCGYVLGTHPDQFGDKSLLRSRLQYRNDEIVCIVAVGGSGVGASLIRKILSAYPAAKEKIPALRMIVVAGPRLAPEAFDLPEGVECRAFVPNLDEHLAACDLALVQGGLSSTMELAAAGTPFLYFPLRNHFEQNLLVSHRLMQYGAGRKMLFHESTPHAIAEAMVEELARPASVSPVENDGALRAAKMLSDLL